MGPPSDAAWPSGDESLRAGEEVVLYGWGFAASGIDGSDEDRAFIAAARTAVPALLDENVALRARIQAARELHRHEVFRGHLDNGCVICGHDYPCPTIEALDGTVTPRDAG